jgi:hypothetical protein
MVSDDELEKDLSWSYDNLRGEARATAAAGIVVIRAIRKFEHSSSQLSIVIALMTFIMLLLTGAIAWFTITLAHKS